MAVVLWCLLVAANLVQSFQIGRTMNLLLHKSQIKMANRQTTNTLKRLGKRNDSREVDKNWINWITRGGSRLQLDGGFWGSVVSRDWAVDWRPGTWVYAPLSSIILWLRSMVRMAGLLFVITDKDNLFRKSHLQKGIRRKFY